MKGYRCLNLRENQNCPSLVLCVLLARLFLPFQFTKHGQVKDTRDLLKLLPSLQVSLSNRVVVHRQIFVNERGEKERVESERDGKRRRCYERWYKRAKERKRDEIREREKK